jgi:hypothetical protein
MAEVAGWRQGAQRREGCFELKTGAALREGDTRTSERGPDNGLTRSECLALLATETMGRVALSIDALPVVLPVDFALVGEDVVFRSLLEANLSPPGVDVVLAFQVDNFGGPAEAGWSVLVQGIASEVVERDEIERCRVLTHSARGGKCGGRRFARIATTRLTGRRFAGATR